MRNLDLLETYRQRGLDVREFYGWEGDEGYGAFIVPSSNICFSRIMKPPCSFTCQRMSTLVPCRRACTLWRPQKAEIPRPPSIMVGLSGKPIKDRAEAMAMRKRVMGEP